MTRILVVDDDEPLRKVVFLSLRLMGHDVIEASNGRAALKLCEIEPPEIVLTDLVMPEKEGLETIRELRCTHPDVKIIAMSGGGRNNAQNYLDIALRMGAVCTLQKPFSHEQLAAAIAAASGSA